MCLTHYNYYNSADEYGVALPLQLSDWAIALATALQYQQATAVVDLRF